MSVDHKNPVIVTMATGGRWVTGHAVTHGRYKKANKHHSPTTRQRKGQGNTAVLLLHTPASHETKFQVCLRYPSLFYPTPSVLRPTLRLPVYKHRSAGLTKISTRL